MFYSKKTILAGSIVALCAAGFVLYEREGFLGLPQWGAALFAATLLLAICAGAAFAVRPDPSAAKFRPARYRGYLTLLFFAAPFIMVVAVERLNGNFLGDLYGWDFVFDNYCVALVLYVAVFALTGRVSTTVISVSGILLAFGIVNMYIKEFKGSPFLPLDAGSIATAATVADEFDYSIGFEVTFAVVLFLVLMGCAWGARMPERSRRRKVATRITALALVLVTCGVFYGTSMPVALGMKPDFFNQMRGYEHRGAIREFANNTRYLRLTAPDGYDADAVAGLLRAAETDETPYILDSAQALANTEENGEDTKMSRAGVPGGMTTAPARETEAGTTGADVRPDIIVVMNESFADLGALGTLEADHDILPFLDSLRGETPHADLSSGEAPHADLTSGETPHAGTASGEARGEGDERQTADNTIAGNVYVSVRGTGTSNTEFEFLTGNSMAFLPAGSNAYQLYVKNAQPGLVSTLRGLGYTAVASHPYFASNWNRPAVYDYMGFEDYISIEDMFPDGFGGTYLSSGDDRYQFLHAVYEAYPDITAVVGNNLSDEFGYQKLIEQYEARDKERPYFHFHITMQNHSPYTSLYRYLSTDVDLTNLEGDYPAAEQYLTRIRESDRALQELVAYFAEVDHPVILLFFGDHQPIVEDGFFAELTGRPLGEWSDEESKALYVTPFVLWANYDIPEGYIDRISANYLSTLLLQTADLPLPAYNQFLAQLYRAYPVITAQGCRDAHGTFFLADAPPNEAAKESLAGYAKIAYNNLIDVGHRVDLF